jgi:hypothetical protein
MLPQQPLLVRCPHCSALVWVDEQELVGSQSPWEREDGAFREAKHYLTPTASDYEPMVSAWAHDRGKCRYLRMHAWWAANDARRRSALPAPFSDEEVRNLEGLIELLDESLNEDRLMKAEALRELSRFEEALRLLAEGVDPRGARAATFIRELATKGDIFVRAFLPAR